MGFKREKVNDYFLLDTGVENIFINEYMAAAPGILSRCIFLP